MGRHSWSCANISNNNGFININTLTKSIIHHIGRIIHELTEFAMKYIFMLVLRTKESLVHRSTYYEISELIKIVCLVPWLEYWLLMMKITSELFKLATWNKYSEYAQLFNLLP